ncbi:hypothetical protein Tco_0320762, partial [Tanacetum coccineum]
FKHALEQVDTSESEVEELEKLEDVYAISAKFIVVGGYVCSTPSTVLFGGGTSFREPPYLFDYPMRRLTMEEILGKFINEGRREHEEMEICIKEFRTTNELLLKTQSNLLSELVIEVNELSMVMSNVLIPKNEVKGVDN